MALLDTFSHGSLSVGSTAVQMASAVAATGVWVKADAGNTGKVYVGSSSSVTASSGTDATDGYELSAGEEVFVPVTNADAIYLIGSAASQEVCFLVL